MEKITNYEEKALNRLPEIMRGKPRIENTVKVLTEQAQKIEDILFQILEENHINSSNSYFVNRYGSDAGIENKGESNLQFSAIVQTTLLKMRNAGQMNVIINSIKSFFMDAIKVEIQPYYPKTILATVYLPESFDFTSVNPFAVQELKKIVVAGVSFSIQLTKEEPETEFVFSNDNTGSTYPSIIE